jgi:hypothetical protein
LADIAKKNDSDARITEAEAHIPPTRKLRRRAIETIAPATQGDQHMIVIAWDYDDTLADWRGAFRDWMATTGRPPAIPIEESVTFSLEDVWPRMPKDELRRKLIEFNLSSAFSDIPTFPGAKEAVAALTSVNGVPVKSVAITAPGDDPSIVAARRAQLRPFKFHGHDILPGGVSKVQSLLGFDAALLIDDSPKALGDAIAAGIPVLIKDAPYNAGIPGPRIRDWRNDFHALEKAVGAAIDGRRRQEIVRRPSESRGTFGILSGFLRPAFRL